MKRFVVLMLAVMVMMAIAVPAMAGGKDGPAGKSNVTQCDFEPFNGYSGDGWAQVQFKDLGSDGFSFVVTGHGLEPGTTYELRSGGDVKASGVANGGGNVLLKGTTDELGARFNIWTPSPTARLLWTLKDGSCL